MYSWYTRNAQHVVKQLLQVLKYLYICKRLYNYNKYV